jgi:hypothetical protein
MNGAVCHFDNFLSYTVMEHWFIAPRAFRSWFCMVRCRSGQWLALSALLRWIPCGLSVRCARAEGSVSSTRLSAPTPAAGRWTSSTSTYSKEAITRDLGKNSEASSSYEDTWKPVLRESVVNGQWRDGDSPLLNDDFLFHSLLSFYKDDMSPFFLKSLNILWHTPVVHHQEISTDNRKKKGRNIFLLECCQMHRKITDVQATGLSGLIIFLLRIYSLSCYWPNYPRNRFFWQQQWKQSRTPPIRLLLERVLFCKASEPSSDRSITK